ncbi:hypothetical protein E3O45_00705 [Cryobacterium sp. TMS1-20-1]|uniref:TadE family type IV pilus minor pilin n=1 Tax=Cryobacterium sp. TMS1-20-1 TaxID=1259223 RepID=UPI00106B714F|nr:TadE family type IV pilus minor pilin [Cryobacterium sp. TMS1-20-1]TFC81902.1 hypothetical protein E3O45_00705 [Cryobacterium sp. TMS1-20-1]
MNGQANRGSITAEFATALPAVVLVLACCLGAVQVVGVQVRLTDAAATAARVLSRGDSVARAAALVAGTVSGAGLAAERRGEFVCARVTATGSGLFAELTLEARSCALAGGQ